MIIEVVAKNPDSRVIQKIIKILDNDGLIVIPTDTIYAFAVSINSKKALEKLAKIKNVKLKKANFSLICEDLKNVSLYTKPIDRKIFRMMKSSLPGPFTFILKANNSVSKIFQTNKKEVGIRVPNHYFVKTLICEIGHPILCSSVNDEDKIIQYTTDPKTIFERHENEVDAIIDCGYGKNVASTVVDCTKEEPIIIRQGAGRI
jgi:tRNA threonylcarbamoyl adenosine modification protein (Sua5/YciO/YrdC/YwlC family)|tara:strand:+ start:1279 stop:1887 length:609 start_codon:yes stop_codon:yes gene_type:complete